MSEVLAKPQPRECVKLAETAAWLDLLYGKCTKEDGKIVVVAANRRVMTGSFFPEDRHRAMKLMQSTPACYAKINLMDVDAIKSRKLYGIGGVAEVKTVVSFHLDVDAGKSGKYVSRRHAMWAMESMPVPPTLIVNSHGDEGGFHAYWILKKPHRIESDRDREKIQAQADAWNEHLKALCGGQLDKTSNLDRVLRCVGVERDKGGLVWCEHYHPEREYELSDLVVTG